MALRDQVTLGEEVARSLVARDFVVTNGDSGRLFVAQNDKGTRIVQVNPR